MKQKSKIWKQKMSSFVIKNHNFSETYFHKIKLTKNSAVVLKIESKSKMVELLLWQQKTLKHCTLNSTNPCLMVSFSPGERNFELRFSIFSVLVFQISVLKCYLDIYLF